MDDSEIELEIGRGYDPDEEENSMPVASLVADPPVSSSSNTANPLPNPLSRPTSTSRPNSNGRNNPLAPPPRAQQNHQFIDDAKATTINRLLQVTGFLGFINTIIAISLAAIIGVDVIIGVILGGILSGIAGMFVSCGFQHLRSFQIRTAIVVFFSILGMACALAEYVAISKVEACAVLTTEGSSAYEYYGQAKYYVDAQTCAIGDSAPDSHCNCVSDQQECVRISFSQNCNAVLNRAPQLAMACVIVALAQFAFSVFALLRLLMSTCTCFRSISRAFKSLVNSMGYEPLPVPDTTTPPRPQPSTTPANNSAVTAHNDANNANNSNSNASSGNSVDNVNVNNSSDAMQESSQALATVPTTSNQPVILEV